MNAVKILPGLTLTICFVASFVTQASASSIVVNSGPFAGHAGQYRGLILQTNAISNQRSGYFSLRLDQQGQVFGSAIIGGRFYRLPSFFFEEFVDADGFVSLDITRDDFWDFERVGRADLQFDLQDDTDQVTGTVSNKRDFRPATWFADLLGDRDIFDSRTNAAPQAGTYTVVIPGGDGISQPAGYGFASVRIDRSGNVNMSGFLADGTLIAERTALAKDGRWPLFNSIYGGDGSVLGWMNFGDTNDLSGNVTWIRPSIWWARAYPDGFTNQTDIVASPWTRTVPATATLGYTDGMVVFSGPNLSDSFTNTFQITSSGKLVNTSGNRMTLSISSQTGWFSGVVTEPATGRRFIFQGALLRDQQVGYGYFLTGNRRSGLVYLGPQE
jgi:hypothetical protein